MTDHIAILVPTTKITRVIDIDIRSVLAMVLAGD